MHTLHWLLVTDNYIWLFDKVLLRIVIRNSFDELNIFLYL